MEKKIGYSIQGILTFAPTYITVNVESEEEFTKITNDELKEIVMKEGFLPKGKSKESITIFRKK